MFGRDMSVFGKEEDITSEGMHMECFVVIDVLLCSVIPCYCLLRACGHKGVES